MADEVNQQVGSPELQPGDQRLPEAGEPEQAPVSEAGVAEAESLAAQTETEESGESAVSEVEAAELERLLVQRSEELTKANTRLSELEQALVGKDDEIATLKQAEVELEEKLTALSNSLAEAVASYKAMVIQANPQVIEELISGDTIEAIDESLNQAKTLVSKVKQGLEAEISLARIPAGAPERTSPDFSALSPREKIQYAIGGNR